MKNLCIVPARSGSKRLIDKNIRPLNGKLLFEYTLDIAVECFTNVIFTSDSQSILNLAKKYNKHDNFATKLEPPELATDTSKVIGIVSHLFEKYINDYDQIWLMLPTCPLRSKQDVILAQGLLTDNVDGVISYTDYDFPPTLGLQKNEKGHLVDFWITNPWQEGNTRSQDHSTVYRPNGALYGMWTNHFREVRNFYKGDIRGYYMPRERSVDIDTELDLIVAETLIKRDKSE